ncbi:helix-turn-helix transcriptional regulator [Streptomyces sp. NPDC059258]|uniref:helix-turn-helix domain-containing protein n=1 Tax=Streptomyces sp. NPDC059258 TaxID=3346795 RepID=UPI0036A517F3
MPAEDTRVSPAVSGPSTRRRPGSGCSARWNGSSALGADQLKQRIALLLSEGLTGQTIAKRMGMSVRTCRRHIAEIMERLGAKSRFQAGFLLSARTDVFTVPEEPGAPEDR